MNEHLTNADPALSPLGFVSCEESFYTLERVPYCITILRVLYLSIVAELLQELVGLVEVLHRFSLT